jgi:cytochrome c oxidase cbb3-type subunit III
MHGCQSFNRRTTWSQFLRIGILAAGIYCFATDVSAQQPLGNPTGRGARGRGGQAQPIREIQLDAAAVDRGTRIFQTNCSFCHGGDARGAAAPDLAQSLIILSHEPGMHDTAIEDDKGKELGEFLKVGRPDKGMPAFVDFTPEQLADLSEFLHKVVADARKNKPMDNNAIVVGDAKAGEAYFNGAGKCNTCHSSAGDFKGIAAKYDAATLQELIVDPRVGRAAAPPPPSTVKVTLPSGQAFSGRLVSVNDFFVTLVDAAGKRRTITRDNEVPKVEIDDPLQAHLDMFLKYTDENMHNLTAYLVTLK